MSATETTEDRIDAQMRAGTLARITGKRWIDQQPLIDRILFWALIATCILGGGLVFMQAVAGWL